MVNIIVVFSSQKDGINIRNLLMRHGHNVVTVCTNGAAVSQAVDQMEGSDGIVVSGYKYQDMTYSDLLADLPDTWQMIVMASQGNLSHIFEYNVIKIPMPVKVYDLFTTLQSATPLPTTGLPAPTGRLQKPKKPAKKSSAASRKKPKPKPNGRPKRKNAKPGKLKKPARNSKGYAAANVPPFRKNWTNSNGKNA